MRSNGIDVTICPVDNDWAVNGQSFMAKVKEFAMKFSLESRIPVALLLVFLLVGCEGSSEVKFRFNQVEWVKQERLNLEDGDHFDEAYKREIGTILTALFGTPDDPRFPFLFDEEDDPVREVLNLENLKMAAGPVGSVQLKEGSGLYREHCVQCHGISGDGRGPTSEFLNPYPRDFRLGKFKFKSTPLRRPPTDEDLTNIIRHGIPGTAMPAFRSLGPKEVASLIDYVKYLSIRGQMERRMLAEIYVMDGDPLLNLELAADEDSREEFEDQLFVIVEEFLIEDIVQRWANADDRVTDVPVPPESFAFEHADHDSFVESGRLLFRGKANCVQCHGPTGLGDGQNKNYDDWTNDWLKTAGVEPDVRESYQHFIDAGAFPPRHISPRNLQLAMFRGGGRPEDIYRRIANGIEGTPMPSAPTLKPEEIWALVAFVREMKFNASDDNDFKSVTQLTAVTE